MFKLGYEGIKDINRPLEGKMPSIIDYFVKVYGEKYRTHITKKLNNACYFFFDDGNKGGIYSTDIYLKEKKAKEIAEVVNFKKKYCGYEILDYENFAKYLPKTKEWQERIPENEYYEFMQFASSVDISSLSKAGTSLSTRKLFGKNHDEGELKKNIENEMPTETLKQILKFFGNEWENFDIVSSNIDYIDSERERLGVKSIGKKITGEETVAAMRLRNLEEETELSIKFTELYVRFVQQVYDIPLNAKNFLYILKIATLYDDFAREREEEDLSNDKVENYIKMFEMINEIANEKIDLTGVESDKKAVVIRHRNEVNKNINTLMIERANLYLQKDLKIGTLPNYELVNELEGRNALDEFEIKMILDERLGFTHYNDRVGGACLNTVNKNTQEQFTVCFNSALPNLSDNSLIHEMGHIIDSSCQFDGETYTFKTGLNISKRGKDKDISSFKTFTRYTTLDEIFNDYFTLQVVREMQKDGYHVGLNQYSVSIYSMAFPFLISFMNKHKQQIIDAKISEDPRRIFKYFSKEKVDALADACKMYFDVCCKNEQLVTLVLRTLKKGDDELMKKIISSQPNDSLAVFAAMDNLAKAVDNIDDLPTNEKEGIKE